MTETCTADDAALALERAVERRVRERTWNRVRDLGARVAGGRLVVCGRVATYYLKQLALEAARELLDPAAPPELVIHIEVL